MLNGRGRSDIHILLVGDGQLKDHFMARKKEMGLENFHIHGMMPKDRLVAYVQNSMVSLVPLKGTPVLDTSSPNKLYESLAAGVPVIQNTKGWIREMLDENGCGFTVDADDERELVDSLIRMADDPETAREMGRKGKELAQREFDKTLLADKMLKVLEGVAASR
jgi:glycosyltransferase involved in cell wall biosynthesis